MTYFSGFRFPPHHNNLKRIHGDSWEAKPCCVENDTKTINTRSLSLVSMGLIPVFTQLFESKLLRSLKLGYINLLFIIMTL